MKALVATAYGTPDQLSIAELPIPRAGVGQIQVRIEAASLNATDIRVITGQFADTLELEFPYVLGNDFAGTVTEVGYGVSGYAVGDAVFGQAMPRQLAAVASPTRPSLSTGSLAEYAVFEADTPLIAHRPVSVSAEDAAALAIAGSAARAVVKTAEIQAGQTVLVIGASGGVGTAVVPLLAAAQAHVVATAGSVEDGEALRRLGADEIVGFDTSEYPKDVDVVLNLVLPGDQLEPAAATLRPNGRLVTIVFPPPAAEQLGRDDVKLDFVMDMEGLLGGMQDAADAAASGLLVATIGGRYSLENAVDAAVAFTTNTLGKIVVTM